MVSGVAGLNKAQRVVHKLYTVHLKCLNQSDAVWNLLVITDYMCPAQALLKARLAILVFNQFFFFFYNTEIMSSK